MLDPYSRAYSTRSVRAGSFPGFLTMIDQDYDQANEKAWLIGAAFFLIAQARNILGGAIQPPRNIAASPAIVTAPRCISRTAARTSCANTSGLSVVSAPYEVDGQVVGTLGVIGPTRMAYERVIPIVDVTAKLVSSALSQH